MDIFKEYRNKNGHIVIPASRECVVVVFGGYGICDFCSKPSDKGFLCPVLSGQWSCPTCYEEWERTAKYYPEDKDYEERKAMQIIKTIVFKNPIFLKGSQLSKSNV